VSDALYKSTYYLLLLTYVIGFNDIIGISETKSNTHKREEEFLPRDAYP